MMKKSTVTKITLLSIIGFSLGITIGCQPILADKKDIPETLVIEEQADDYISYPLAGDAYNNGTITQEDVDNFYYMCCNNSVYRDMFDKFILKDNYSLLSFNVVPIIESKDTIDIVVKKNYISGFINKETGEPLSFDFMRSRKNNAVIYSSSISPVGIIPVNSDCPDLTREDDKWSESLRNVIDDRNICYADSENYLSISKTEKSPENIQKIIDRGYPTLDKNQYGLSAEDFEVATQLAVYLEINQIPTADFFCDYDYNEDSQNIISEIEYLRSSSYIEPYVNINIVNDYLIEDDMIKTDESSIDSNSGRVYLADYNILGADTSYAVSSVSIDEDEGYAVLSPTEGFSFTISPFLRNNSLNDTVNVIASIIEINHYCYKDINSNHYFVCEPQSYSTIQNYNLLIDPTQYSCCPKTRVAINGINDLSEKYSIKANIYAAEDILDSNGTVVCMSDSYVTSTDFFENEMSCLLTPGKYYAQLEYSYMNEDELSKFNCFENNDKTYFEVEFKTPGEIQIVDVPLQASMTKIKLIRFSDKSVIDNFPVKIIDSSNSEMDFITDENGYVCIYGLQSGFYVLQITLDDDSGFTDSFSFYFDKLNPHEESYDATYEIYEDYQTKLAEFSDN